MNKIRKNVFFLYMYTVIMIVVMCNQPIPTSIITLIGNLLVYGWFFLFVINVIHNRRKIVENKKCSTLLLAINIYFLNIL
ncbi:MAG: hypothetical protein ACYDEX_17645, partial [Mobilitalea sp.]